MQSWTKYLETFSRFNTISLHHKWNGTRLLSPESEFTSFCTSYRKCMPNFFFGNCLKHVLQFYINIGGLFGPITSAIFDNLWHEPPRTKKERRRINMLVQWSFFDINLQLLEILLVFEEIKFTSILSLLVPKNPIHEN